jgi:hypothetical protein
VEQVSELPGWIQALIMFVVPAVAMTVLVFLAATVIGAVACWRNR